MTCGKATFSCSNQTAHFAVCLHVGSLFGSIHIMPMKVWIITIHLQYRSWYLHANIKPHTIRNVAHDKPPSRYTIAYASTIQYLPSSLVCPLLLVRSILLPSYELLADNMFVCICDYIWIIISIAIMCIHSDMPKNRRYREVEQL